MSPKARNNRVDIKKYVLVWFVQFSLSTFILSVANDQSHVSSVGEIKTVIAYEKVVKWFLKEIEKNYVT